MSLAQMGQLKERIKVIKETTEFNTYGDEVVTEEIIYTLWTKPLSQLISEVKANLGDVMKDQLTFVIRYNQSFDITLDMFVVYKNKKYNIKKYTPDETNKEWSTIFCEAVD